MSHPANAELRASMERLARQKGWEWADYIPGIAGEWKVADLREGLEMGALDVHSSGDSLCISITEDHAKMASTCPCCRWYARMWARDAERPVSDRWRAEMKASIAAAAKRRTLSPLAQAFGLEEV